MPLRLHARCAWQFGPAAHPRVFYGWSCGFFMCFESCQNFGSKKSILFFQNLNYLSKLIKQTKSMKYCKIHSKNQWKYRIFPYSSIPSGWFPQSWWLRSWEDPWFSTFRGQCFIKNVLSPNKLNYFRPTEKKALPQVSDFLNNEPAADCVGALYHFDDCIGWFRTAYECTECGKPYQNVGRFHVAVNHSSAALVRLEIS